MKRNIRLVISYDGTEFSGWQIQNSRRSVQGEIQRALEDLHGSSVALTGSGRTDAGVHAQGQVANFYTEMDSVPSDRFREALNARLPLDVRILSSAEVNADFHSRRDAVLRCYEYKMMDGFVVPVHLARYTWAVKEMPSLTVLNNMARQLCGTHDFSTFAAAGDASASRVRDIHQAVFLGRGPQVVFRIAGNAFLWKMVRSILGTLVDLARQGGSADDFRRILVSRERGNAGPTAPARGLFLTKVFYGNQTGTC